MMRHVEGMRACVRGLVAAEVVAHWGEIDRVCCDGASVGYAPQCVSRHIKTDAQTGDATNGSRDGPGRSDAGQLLVQYGGRNVDSRSVMLSWGAGESTSKVVMQRLESRSGLALRDEDVRVGAVT